MLHLACVSCLLNFEALDLMSVSILLFSLDLAGVPLAFISFVVYEKKEEEIDDLVRKFLSFGCKLKSDVSGKISSSKKQQ